MVRFTRILLVVTFLIGVALPCYAGPLLPALGFVLHVVLFAGAGMALATVAQLLFGPKRDKLEDGRAYFGDYLRTTVSREIPVPRAFGKVRAAGNKVRMSPGGGKERNFLVALCLGPIEGITRIEINDVEWSELEGAQRKTEYLGTDKQLPNWFFEDEDKVQAMRGVAYVGFALENTSQIASPNFCIIFKGQKLKTLDDEHPGICTAPIIQYPKTWFWDTTLVAYPDRFWDEYTLTWTTGSNIGESGSITRFDTGGVVYCSCGFTNDISIGDEYILTCDLKWTNNPAVILWNFYQDVIGYDAAILDLDVFKLLRDYCDEIPEGSIFPRYTFDYIFDGRETIN